MPRTVVIELYDHTSDDEIDELIYDLNRIGLDTEHDVKVLDATGKELTRS